MLASPASPRGRWPQGPVDRARRALLYLLASFFIAQGAVARPPEALWEGSELNGDEAALEALYGHELSAANLQDIAGWRVHDPDWWLGYDRNLAAFEKRMVLEYHSSNTVRTIEDPRQHEELFGIDVVAAPSSFTTLEHARRLRPDLIVLSDEIESYVVGVLRPHVPDWTFGVSFWELLELATELERKPEIREQLGHLAYLEHWYQLSRSEIRSHTRLFIYKALHKLMPELQVHPSVRADQKLEEAQSFYARMQTYEGDDPRQAFSDYVLEKRRAAFESTFANVETFLASLPENAQHALLLFMLNDRLWHESEVRAVTPSEWNQVLLADVAESIRGTGVDFSTRAAQPTLGALSVRLTVANGMVLRRKKDISYDLDDPLKMTAEGKASFEPGPVGPKGPSLQVTTNVPFLLDSIESTIEVSISLLFSKTAHLNALQTAESSTANHRCEAKPTGGKGTISLTKTCSMPAAKLSREFAIKKGGWYLVTYRSSGWARPSFALDSGTPIRDLGNGVKATLLPDGVIRISGPGFTYDFNHPLYREEPDEKVHATPKVQFAHCGWDLHLPSPTGPGDGGDLPVCRQCPEGMVADGDRGCRCEEGLVASTDAAGEPICVEPCVADPSLCEPPEIPDGGAILVDFRPDVPLGPEDGVLWPDWFDGLPDREECEKVTAMVCTEVFIGGEVAVECVVQWVCADGGHPKRIDCAEGHWWPYCLPRAEIVAEMPARAFCTPGESRCLGDGKAQVCRAEGFWGPIETCVNGCDAATGLCRQEAGPSECGSGQQRCLDADTVQLCENQLWGSTEPCAHGCDSLGQACRPAESCAPGQRRCSLGDTSVQLCEGSGSWGAHQTCAYGCDPSSHQCLSSPGDCGSSYPGRCAWAGERSCNGHGDVLVCDFNASGCLTWQAHETCESGCSGGACEGSVCTGSDVCASEGASRCVGASGTESCRLASDGCLRWSPPPGGGSCGSGQVCESGACSTVSCSSHIECFESSRSCQDGSCAPCSNDADCGGAPWVCSQTTQRCYAAF